MKLTIHSSLSLVTGLVFTACTALGTLIAHGDLLAYEGFDYPAGSALAGQTGPIGFSEPYLSANDGCKVSSPGFAYGDMSVTGNKLDLAGNSNNGNFGVFTNAPQTPGTSVYFSYLMKANTGGGYAGVSLFDADKETLFTGKRGGSDRFFGVEVTVGSSADTNKSCSHLSLIVCRIDFEEDEATIRLYVNPQSAEEPEVADAVSIRSEALTYDRVRFQSNLVNGSIDEFRLGDTFADVVPISYGSIPQEIVVIGSSVAAGQGADPRSEGWAYRLATLLEDEGPVVADSPFTWHIEHESIGGNRTSNVLSRFQSDIVNAHPDANIVVIGLSLANEGLVNSANPQAAFDSFKNGMEQIISRCRDHGYYPVVTLCYPHSDYSPSEYGYLKQMNLLLNSWDVPTANFLGVIDDGAGRWAPGNFADGGHPNSLGHKELFSSIVPSLFDAIASGKTTTPNIDETRGYFRVQRDAEVESPLLHTPTHPVRSFTLAFRVRSTDTGTIAAIGNESQPATLEIRDNSLIYISPDGSELSVASLVNDGRWHQIALAHRHAAGKSLLFVDGQLKGSIDEQYAPEFFVVGGAASAAGRAPAPQQADYQDVCIYRAAWTEDEALAQDSGALQQASMEICAPLSDSSPSLGEAVENRAQSFSTLVLQSSSVTPHHADNTPTQLEAESYAGGAVTLNWENHANASDPVTIERRRSDMAEAWTVVGTVEPGVTFFDDGGLSSNIGYEYRISTTEADLQGDYSNVVQITPGGQHALSYDAWINSYYEPEVEDNPVYLVDFNEDANPNYGDETWNTVTSSRDSTLYALKDSENRPSPFTVRITDSFDQYRSDPVAPLAGYPAAAQFSQFCLRDDVPLSGAIEIGGLDPEVSYDFSFFARRGSLVGGFDYSGTYTFTGAGEPVVVVVDSKDNKNMTRVAPLWPSQEGTITLTITAGPGAGTDFPVINFLKFQRSTPRVCLIDFNTESNPDYGGVQWNTVTSTSNSTPYPLLDTDRNATGISVAILDSFDQFRNDDVSPLADFPAAAQNSQFCLRDNRPLVGTIQFTGLDPAARYDFSFLARRGALVDGYDYTGTYTFSGGEEPTVVIVDSAHNTELTKVPSIAPTSEGVVTLSVTAGPGAGIDFPVINFIQIQEALIDPVHAAMIAPDADPDGDGITNFEEYALGFNPTVKDSSVSLISNIAIDQAGQKAAFEYTRSSLATDAGYLVETSDDLITWQNDLEASESVISRNGTQETILIESPADAPRKFIRLRLTNLTEEP